MKRYFQYARGYTKECILGPLFKLFEATLELIVPLVIAAMIDKGIGGGDGSYVWKMALLLVAFGAVGLMFSVTAQFFAAKAAVGYTTKLRSSLYRHIQNFSYTELDAIGTSTLITRMTTDTNQVQSGINLTLRLLLRSPFVVFGAMIMAFTIDVRAALIFLAVIPVLFCVVFAVMLTTIPLYKKAQERLERVLLSTRENITGARVLRAFCKEEEECKSFAGQTKALYHAQSLVGKISALLNPITYVVINLAIVFLIYIGALRVEAGVLTQGALIALYNYMSQILVELIKLANMIINLTKSIASLKRIDQVMHTESSMKEGKSKAESSSEQILSFENVSLRYGGAGASSLEDITFTVTKGQTVGIIGGTGSGKSSLVNLIPRFYDATEGRVLFAGENVKDYTFRALRESIGLVPQRAVLFRGTVRENMKLGNESATDEQILTALEKAQVLEVVMEKGGLDFMVEQGGRNLSGGQKQRLTIARALVRDPQMLILDDSSSALDYATDAALRRDIRTLSASTTILIVSQRTSSIMEADQILVLDDGRLVGKGTHTSLLSDCEIYREIHHSQYTEEEQS